MAKKFTKKNPSFILLALLAIVLIPLVVFTITGSKDFRSSAAEKLTEESLLSRINVWKNSVLFDRVNKSFIRVPTGSAAWFSSSGNYTIETWYKTPDYNVQVNQRQEILSSIVFDNDNDPTGVRFFFDNNGRLLVFRAFDTKGKKYQVSGTDPLFFQNSTWYHLAAVKDGKKLKLYVNGELISSTEAVGDLSPIKSFSVGALLAEGSQSNFLSGQLEGLRISSNNRYQGKKIEVPLIPFSKDNSTQLLYQFNQNTGVRTLRDSSKNKLEGKIVGNLQFVISTTPTKPPYTAILKIYAAGNFDNGDYPTMDVEINPNSYGANWKTFEDVSGNPVARKFNEYLVVHPYLQAGGVKKVRILFQNQSMGRYLTVDKVDADGKIYETEDLHTFSKGQCFSEGYNERETLDCNGEFIFDLDKYIPQL